MATKKDVAKKVVAKKSAGKKAAVKRSAADAVDEQLARYRAMRHFDVTTEPAGSKKDAAKTKKGVALPFVIQKHAAGKGKVINLMDALRKSVHGKADEEEAKPAAAEKKRGLSLVKSAAKKSARHEVKTAKRRKSA